MRSASSRLGLEARTGGTRLKPSSVAAERGLGLRPPAGALRAIRIRGRQDDRGRLRREGLRVGGKSRAPALAVGTRLARLAAAFTVLAPSAAAAAPTTASAA